MAMDNFYSDVTELIGSTPLLKINRMAPANGAEILAKLEWYNIGGSVKDRVALYMIEFAEASGTLTRDKTIIEATSGNTGIALAMIGAYRGYHVTIVMSESASPERRKIISAYGADLILTPASKGTAGAIELKNRLIEENPEKYVSMDQFRNPANVFAHYHGTASEILKQTGGRIDMVVCTVGTGGTSNGIGKKLKESVPGLKLVGVTPALGVSIQGIRNPKEPNPSQWVDMSLFDEFIELTESERDEAFKTGMEAARKEGLLLGMSSSCALHIAIKEAAKIGAGKRIVVILPDNGMKYLSGNYFTENSRKIA